MKNREAFATALAVLGNTYDRKLTGPAIEGYWIALSDLSEDEFARATKKALSASKFMPSPSELLAFAGHAPPDHEADAVEAWSVVRACVDSVDYTGSVDFGPLVNAVIWNLGGFARLCELGLTELNVWAKKDFERVYCELAEKNRAALRCEPFIGFLRQPPKRIAIGGKMPPLALPAAPNPVSDIVRELADAKSPGAPAAAPERTCLRCEWAASDCSCKEGPLYRGAIPTRPEKAKAPPMTEADVEARKAEIRAQMAARGVTLPESVEAAT